MIFQSRWKNAAYIVRPTIREVIPGYGINIKPGLRAEFTGAVPVFDSQRMQDKYSWSDEEREQVEKHLLKHKDYGNGIYLAPGQELPKELEKVARVLPKDKKASRCVFVQYVDGQVEQCDQEALVGGNRCATHREGKTEVVKGMLTAE